MSKIKWFLDAVWWKCYYLREKFWLKNCIDGEVQRVKRGKFRNQNPDKTFYCIRRKGDFAGLFSYVLIVMEKLEFCDREGWIPVVDMKHTINSYLYRSRLDSLIHGNTFLNSPADIG